MRTESSPRRFALRAPLLAALLGLAVTVTTGGPARIVGGDGAAHACGKQGPPQDRDGDGVPDEIDRCPDKPGPRDNLGCQDRDEDKDGIVDRLDACPTVPGSAAAHGCPDETTPSAALSQGQQGQQPGALPGSEELATWRGNHFEWPEPVAFEPAQDTLTDRGLAAVASAARVILSHPEIRKLVIEGHVDEPGNTAQRARDLSQRRAETVKRNLVQLGVPAERLQTRGYGYSKLIDRSETPAAAKRNNRVEIVSGE